MNDDFYIGYLPKAPPRLARFVRSRVSLALAGVLGLGGTLAATLAYAGNGRFEFGNHRRVTGSVACATAPTLSTASEEYLVVGYGKRRAPIELCSASGQVVELDGTLIEREGRSLLEVASFRSTAAPPAGPPLAPQLLGRFTLVGEIVDSKCYFGVMNPAEGQVHRACAELCLRGGVPAVFVVRDRSGAVAHLLLAGPNGEPINDQLLPWIAAPVQIMGEVFRQGRWLALRLDPRSIERAGSHP